MASPSLLFLNRVYPPAAGATGELLAELAPELVKAGWQVTVVTGPAPGAPASEIADGVRVERVGGLPLTRTSHARRVLSYLTLYPRLLWRALRLPRAEVIVTLTDPPLQCMLGPLLKACKGSRLVHWAQDLYPELAEEMEVLPRHGLRARLLRRLSTWALNRSDRNIVIGRCMKSRLEERGVAAGTMVVIPNWGHRTIADCGLRIADCGGLHPDEGARASNPERARRDVDENSFRREHDLMGRFVVMYSGNLGLAHPFAAMLEAAERLQPVLPQVVFLFVGQGPRLPWVMEQARQRQLANVRFLPLQPRANLGQSLRAADVHLASMREDLCGLVVPSKVYGVLAAGRPCLFLGPPESEAAQLILRAGCGAVLPSTDGAKVAQCLEHWATDPAAWQSLQARSQAVAQRVGLSSAVPAFLGLLASVAGAVPASGGQPAPLAAHRTDRIKRAAGRLPLGARLEMRRRFPTRMAKASGPGSD